MNIQIAKEQLKEKGYCVFNLKYFNEEYYNFFKENFLCNEFKNLQSAFKSLRADYSFEIKKESEITHGKIQTEFETFEEANFEKNKILDKKEKKEIAKISQIWYYTEPHRIESIIKKQDTSITLKTITSNIAKFLYDLDKDSTLEHLLTFTYYDRGCHLENHSDGYGGARICACLIYLNETYDEKDGGYLVLNNELNVLPEIANVAIIDLTKFDIPHMVTEVTGGIGRYACLDFISKPGMNWK